MHVDLTKQGKEGNNVFDDPAVKSLLGIVLVSSFLLFLQASLAAHFLERAVKAPTREDAGKHYFLMVFFSIFAIFFAITTASFMVVTSLVRMGF
jgi:hypothetical protein